MDIEIFKELGFTDREIKVYVALLELGSSTVGPISAKSGLQHTKVYETLQKLIEKGLVHYVVISKTKYFEAAPPKDILNVLEERKRKFAEILEELELKQKFAKERQMATVHEGYKAVKALFNRMAEELQKKDFYYAFAFKEFYREVTVPLFFRAFHNKLEEKKIPDKIIAHIEVKKEVKAAYKGNKNIQLRFTRFNTPLGLIVIPNKVIQVIWGERPTAIEITSSQIYQQYKKFFEEMWEEAKE
jgi:sugar-specific transcriptional regulator TrmB